MLITLENIGAYIAVLTFTSLFVKNFLIDPLKKSIDDLTAITKELTNEMQTIRERLVIAEQSIKSEHKRLDTYESRIQELEHKCVNCECRN